MTSEQLTQVTSDDRVIGPIPREAANSKDEIHNSIESENWTQWAKETLEKFFPQIEEFVTKDSSG